MGAGQSIQQRTEWSMLRIRHGQVGMAFAISSPVQDIEFLKFRRFSGLADECLVSSHPFPTFYPKYP